MLSEVKEQSEKLIQKIT